MRGASLEAGIRHAGALYRQARRCAVIKQEIRRLWDGTPAGKAPVDFIGPMGQRTIAIEAKETEKSYFEIFNEKVIAPAQIKACGELAACGADVYLVVDFTSWGEVYSVPWADVAAFLAAPWLTHLPFDWFRAYGKLLPDVNRGEADKRRVMFLDGARHDESELSLDRVLKEKAAAAERPAAPERELRPTKAQLELRARYAQRPDPVKDPEGHRRYMVELVNEGMMNAARGKARKQRAGGRR